MLGIVCYSFWHTANKGIAIEQTDELVVHDGGDTQVTQQVTPFASLGGINELHERKWTQVEIFHSGNREGDMFFQ